MKTRFCYGFEELTDDLPRPPKAALRAMFAAGILVSPRGWKQLSNQTRQALALEGTRDRVNIVMVAELLKDAPPGQIRLVSKNHDPAADAVPAALARALGPMRTLSAPEWASLRALDRYVLASLAANTRLLWRALDELSREPGSQLSRKIAQPWSGWLARCELGMSPEAMQRLTSPTFLEGRAFVLARAAGVRAARKVSDMLDLQADTVAGPAELDWAQGRKGTVITWQAHVSTWDGEFFPAASLLAVNTAAVALYDMAKELDPRAEINGATIAEEPWQGGPSEREESTSIYSVQANPELFPSRLESGASEPGPASSSRGPTAASSVDRPDPFSSRVAPAPAPPPNLVQASSQEGRSSQPPERRLTTRSFMLLLMLSMVVVAVVSTVVSVVVVKLIAD